jgi:6-phosphogluconolactonase/glucosamine-6-phosphate isomerase/deaminase
MTVTIKEIHSTNDAANFLAQTIIKHLQNEKRVLWLVPGGSAITLAVEAAKIISERPHANLSVTLTDERYGPVGHKDSNWQQLFDQGFCLPSARLFPVLQGESIEMTSTNFGNIINREFALADYTIGLFGIGADGHTAGIMPKEGEVVFAQGPTCSYKTSAFERVTITTKVILELNEAVLYAEGEAKRQIVASLEKELGVFQEPAQVLKKVPLTVFLKI